MKYRSARQKNKMNITELKPKCELIEYDEEAVISAADKSRNPKSSGGYKRRNSSIGSGGSPNGKTGTMSFHLQRSLIKTAAPNYHSPSRGQPVKREETPSSEGSRNGSDLKDTRILRLEVFNNKKKSTNPNSKYIQKLKAKIDNEDRLEALYKLKRESKAQKSSRFTADSEERVDISGNPLDKYEVDMKDIIRKALMMRLGKP